jgi:serine phosphatase RsbU (regulator of sigma subunit)
MVDQEKIMQDLIAQQKSQQSKIDKRNSVLKELNYKIKLQESNLVKKDKTIDTQEDTITTLALLIGIIAVLIIFVLIGYKKLSQSKKQIESQQKDLKKSHNEISFMNEQISKSIDFASLIQKTFYHNHTVIDEFFEDSFITLKEREAVGGDIVLFEKIDDDQALFFIIDCTSHGVPGAFVSMIVKTLQRQILNSVLIKNEEISPANILRYFNQEIKDLLHQTSNHSPSNVGFDGQVLYYNKSKNIIKFASARNDVIVINNNEVTRYRGDKHSVGYKDSDAEYQFSEYEIKIEDEICLYMYSDGYTDQLGGNKIMPYGIKKTIDNITKCMSEDMSSQNKFLISELEEYQGDEEQNDDISFVGLKIVKS